MVRLADLMLRARYGVAAAWLVAAAISLAAVTGVFGTKLGDLLSNRFDLPGTESEHARSLLAEHFGQRPDSAFTIVFSGHIRPAAQTAALRRAAAALPHARIGPLQPAGPNLAFAQLDTTLEPQPAALRTEAMRRAIGTVAAGRVYVSGQVAINHDLQPVFDADLRRGEEIAIPIAILVLLIVFGTATGTLVPLLMAAGTVPVTLGLLWVVAHEMNMAIYVTNLVTLIGIAIAIDYSLLVVYRFREELVGGSDVRDSLRTTMRTAGHAVLFSGATVAIGLACLVLIPLPFIRSMGVGGLLIPLVSIFAALTLLPALLAIFGRSLLRLRVPFIGLRPDDDGGLWARIAETIMRRPAIVAGLTAGCLILLALPAPFLSLTPGSSKGLPAQSQAVQGLKLLEHTLGPGTITPLIAVVDSGHPGGIGTAAPAIRRLVSEVRADPEVTIVQTPTDTGLPTYLPADPSGRYARVVVSTRHDYGTDEAKKLAARFRHDYVPRARFGAAHVYAGGGPPAGVDFINRAYGLFPWLVLGVLAVTYVVLMRAFRSLLLPLKAVLLNLLSVGATYGLLVITFRWGAGAIIGLPQADQIEAWIPMFLFAMLFGLSMDYEVFLLSRMRELYDETGDTERAVALGLMRTGRIVTAAAAIMVAAFSGFMLGSLIGLVQFGFGLAAAITIDATIIRALLVPALMKLMGEWNWYLPAWIERVLRLEPGERAPGTRSAPEV
ncbi:MAG: putative drug exporter of the superfamily [Gaiellales bacterium]|nr:putative drug exporter of the superfamily [Gaiellales bacterium]